MARLEFKYLVLFVIWILELVVYRLSGRGATIITSFSGGFPTAALQASDVL